MGRRLRPTGLGQSMGLTTITLELSPERGKGLRKVSIDALVDTGATFTVIPAPTLRRLGVEREGRIFLKLGDGRLVRRSVGSVRLRIGNRYRRIPVVFGSRGDPVLLGSTALDILGFAVDPTRRELIPKRYFLHYLSA